MFSLAGKVALVTGASRGLGWAMAQSLATAGAHVILNARDPEALDGRVKGLQAKGLKGEAAAFDVTDHAAGAACIQGAAKRYGRFDILVANAGIQHRKPITEFETADFQRVIDTNLTAVWALAKEAARVMIPRKAGRIIFTGSTSAIRHGRPSPRTWRAKARCMPSLASWRSSWRRTTSPSTRSRRATSPLS